MCAATPCFGIAWAVEQILQPGESITLNSLPGNYAAANSSWQGWLPRGTTDLYVYADSWNPAAMWGAVLEHDEANNRAELHGLEVTGRNPALAQRPRALEPRPQLSLR